MPFKLSPKTALGLFIAMVVFLLAQAVWWVVFMARLVDEKVLLAEELGASGQFVDSLHQEEISRQVMVGLEGVVFLLLIFAGIWLIYRSLVKTEELKFHQQNFLLAVTHELKTPLSSIKVYLDTLTSQKIPDAKKQAVIPKMKEDVSRLEKHVEKILEAGRFERAGYTLNLEYFDLTRLVQERIAALERITTRVPIAVKPNLEKDVTFHGDEMALGRAIDAILENSLKYHVAGGIEIDVSLSVRDSRIVLEIADRGIGLERKELETIFERFYRVGDELTRGSEGTGLGLYLCREIVRALGGDVTARSDGPGKGARFTITLKQSKVRENDIAG
ncbi:MAG TPA: HAMP domain-containing sensor histidine kinase [Acidobacteriota bacterium]|nr:HAMP domain-containing sensor histidine kinase [Acidobacteriota bacterium]